MSKPPTKPTTAADDAWLKLHIVDGYTAAEAELAVYDAANGAGRIAYLAGQPESDCPHPEPGPAREGWLDGYHG